MAIRVDVVSLTCPCPLPGNGSTGGEREERHPHRQDFPPHPQASLHLHILTFWQLLPAKMCAGSSQVTVQGAEHQLPLPSLVKCWARTGPVQLQLQRLRWACCHGHFGKKIRLRHNWAIQNSPGLKLLLQKNFRKHVLNSACHLACSHGILLFPHTLPFYLPRYWRAVCYEKLV